MKLKVDIGDPLEIPDVLLKRFYDSLTPEEKQEVKDEQTFQDMFEHFKRELLEEYAGKSLLAR